MWVLHRYAFLNEIAGARIFSHARVNAPEKDQSTEGWSPPWCAGNVFDPAWHSAMVLGRATSIWQCIGLTAFCAEKVMFFLY